MHRIMRRIIAAEEKTSPIIEKNTESTEQMNSHTDVFLFVCYHGEVTKVPLCELFTISQMLAYIEISTKF